MCGHWCVYKHVCVPMYASMLSLYMRYVCMCTCVYSLIVSDPFTSCVGEGAHMYMSFSTNTCSCRVP